MEVNGKEEVMKKFSEECIPCCYYCKYVVHEVIERFETFIEKD